MNDRFQCGIKVGNDVCLAPVFSHALREGISSVRFLVSSPPPQQSPSLGEDAIGEERQREKEKGENWQKQMQRSLSSTGNKQNRGKTDRRDAFVVTCFKNQKKTENAQRKKGSVVDKRISVENRTSFRANWRENHAIKLKTKYISVFSTTCRACPRPHTCRPNRFAREK